jgi:ComF family protein
MKIAERLISVLAPHCCLGCGNEGAVVCRQCLADLPSLAGRCYRCHLPCPGQAICAVCRSSGQLQDVTACTRYDGVAKAAIRALKFSGAQATAVSLARQMSRLVPPSQNVYITPIPTATSRRRTRGYDQAVLLSLAIVRQTRAVYLPCLTRHGQAHQVGSNRQARLQQLVNAFRAKRLLQVRGAHIILIDDVLTTGATLEAAAAVLYMAGAQSVEAIVFAQA